MTVHVNLYYYAVLIIVFTTHKKKTQASIKTILRFEEKEGMAVKKAIKQE